MPIGNYYWDGGFERDEKKAIKYYELAAMGGSVLARNDLGFVVYKAGNMDRALRHYLIAVKDEYSESLGNIILMYSDGDATKDDYANALRSYQEYLDEVKSDQRDDAAAADDKLRHY